MVIPKRFSNALLFISVIALANRGYAQSITPANDGLNTNVDQVGNQYNITGGTQAGGNLFYSLQKLGLSTGEIANFLSNPNVQNVLTRVTGGEASLINGLIQVTGGNSNLFIMNPAGIVFGANSSLNVPASFSATTASGIQVGNGWFGINSSVDEVRNLTGNVTGYAFTNTLPSVAPNPSGVILNEGNLNVSAGKSVTLVGGMVVNTGTIATPSGNITIAATPDNKFIKITSEGSLLSLELPIADRQAAGNAPVLRGVDLPSLLTGKTAGTAIASAQVGDVIVEDAFIRAGTVNLHATNNLGVSNSWVIGTDKLTGTGNNVNVNNTIVLAKDATVVAKNNLNIAESLVRTTGNLALQANNVVTMRDSVKTPLAIISGGNLKIQGNNAIDIWALKHSNITPFISGGNLDLISNGNVSFDAHSYTGGGFSIKKLDGALGTFVSLFDPIISSNGDVTFGDYTGVSLKVETKGSITAGNITITGPDVGLVGTDTDIPTLTSSASLILRAGLTTLQNAPNNAPQNFGGVTFTTAGTKGATYSISTPTFNFQDISGTGTFIPLGDDQVSGAIPLGFSFGFFGTNYTNVYVSSNGFITVLPAQSSGCCSGQALPSTGGPNGVIAAWWEDFNVPQGNIRYQTLGTSGSQTFITQYTNVPHFLGVPVTWQIKLFEGSNNIEVHYPNAVSDGGTHSAGIENQTGTIGNQFYRGTAGIPANTAVAYSNIIIPTVSAGTIAVGNITTAGGPIILQSPAGITLNGNSVSGDSATFDGALSLTQNTTITANEINFNGGANSVAGNGLVLALAPANTNQNIQVGLGADTGTTSLDLTKNDLAALKDGFTSIIINNAANNGIVTLNTGVTFNDPVNIAGGSTLVDANSNITFNIGGVNQFSLAGYPNGLTFAYTLPINPNQLTIAQNVQQDLKLSSLSPVAFLSSDDIEFQRLERFLIVIVELMNKDGGDLAIDAKDIIFDQSANQDVIKLAIRRSIGKFIGNEFIDLVDVNFEAQKDNKTILLKVRKSPKPAKFLKD
ncbi:filamentous hemagglutinin N-terminal domain-containing protein [Pseudanabaena minima]|uniref:two-partner secretion domain-containing protein n=1 Tax=Pseudanabaena minima TaxID=890415 RepID=UPI003DA971E1